MTKLEQVTPHVVADTSTQRVTRSCVMGGISLDNFIIAIDSGCSFEVGKVLRRELKTYFNLQVRYLFLTHTHTDHRKGMDAFTDTTLIMSRHGFENMPKYVRLKKWSKELFDNKLTIDDGSLNLEFHLVSGHSIGSSIAYIPEENVLFGGDLFFSSNVNYGLPVMHFYQNRPKRTGNPDEYIVAYENFRKWGVEIIVPGHGDIIPNAHEYLDNQILFFKELRSFFISALNDKTPLDDIQLPKLEPIKQAYTTAQTHAQKSQSLRWLDHYLELLKLSFYNHYSGSSKSMQ